MLLLPFNVIPLTVQKNTIIPFQVEILNVGGGMNTATGVFTAPVDGIYYFVFSGIKVSSADVSWAQFQKNGVAVGSSYTETTPAISECRFF